MNLTEAAARADELAAAGDQKALATLRQQWEEELEHSARSPDYRIRAQAYRAIAQFRFRQKLELLRRGLEDDSPAVRGSALIALEGLSRAHPGDVNAYRPLLRRARECQRIRGLLPNLLAVDFYREGDVFGVADTLNGLR